jgi:8-amino-7-oxononanoate synthase
MAGQVRAALRIAQEMNAERSRLITGAERLKAKLQSQGYDTANSASQIIPVIVGANDEAVASAEFLQGEGFAVRAIRPPTVPAGRARLRLSLTSAISTTEIDRLSNRLSSWKTQRVPLAAGCS